MAAPDLLNDLLSSDPNEPASKGVVLLFRAEVKSEFKTLRSEIGRLDGRMDSLEQRMDRLEVKVDKMSGSLELVAQQIAILVAR